VLIPITREKDIREASIAFISESMVTIRMGLLRVIAFINGPTATIQDNFAMENALVLKYDYIALYLMSWLIHPLIFSWQPEISYYL
jgi:hypothetical protein